MSAPAQDLLRAERVSIARRRRRIVHEADLVLRSGEVHALVGPNGAGKSTLLRAMAGLLPIVGGTVRTPDGGLSRLSARERARLVAFLPQDTHVEAGLRVDTVVGLGRYAHHHLLGRVGGDLTREDREIIDASLRRVGASDLAHRRIDQLSGGQQQIVLIAKQLAQSSRVLLLDEPVSALDLGFQLDVLDLVRGLAAEGRAVALVLHDLNLAARAGDRLTLLRGGRVLASGEPAAVLRDDLLASAYGIRTQIDRDPTTARPRVTAVSRL
jgi:iron complex transport system ATP-binding protein